MQTQPGIAAGIINVAMDFGYRRGLTPQQVAREVQHTPVLRRPACEKYPMPMASALLDALITLTGHSPSVPCEALATVRCGDYGLLGLLLLAAPDASVGMEHFVRLHSLAADAGGWVMRSVQEGVQLTYSVRQFGPLLNSAWEQAAVTSFVGALRDALGPFPIARICFRNPAPRVTEYHELYFGCPLHFDAGETSVVLSYDVLRRRPRLSDVDMFRFLGDHANAEVKVAAAPLSFLECVRTAILAALDQGDLASVRIAQRMGMSERTLRRRLDMHGHSYRELVDETRMIVADRLLLDPERSVSEIAVALGFSEVGAFSRAYRRLRGNAPRRGRRKAR